MNQEHYNAVREAVIKAVPEIMELDFGCEVEILTSLLRVGDKAIDALPEGDMSKCIVLYYTPGGFNGQDYDGDTLAVYSPDWSNKQVFGEWGDGEDMPDQNHGEMKILGRPIRLDDCRKIIKEDFLGELIEMWRDGLLENQPEEVIKWLYENIY